jgi:thiosulfate/3-mercaptopyruvate sulfurtransferase
MMLMILALMIPTSTRAWVHQSAFQSKRSRSFSSLYVATEIDNLRSPPNLLYVDECLKLSKAENVVFVDGTWFHKGNRNGRQEFEEGPRIAGARHVDMSDIATTKDLFPILNPQGLQQMLPTADLFALTMDAFNITNDDHVIVYAKQGALFTPRTWFLFRHFGHVNVSLMQGSLEEWIAKGGRIDTQPTTVPTALSILAEAKSRRPLYQCNNIRNDVVDKCKMLDVVNSKSAKIIDPRGSSFRRNGHMPDAIHIPYSSLVEKDNALQLKPRQELMDIFQNHGIDIDNANQEIIASCGHGVSVCHVLLALEECGRTENVYMYDGSWQEWSLDPTTPKVFPEQQSA